MSAFFGRKCNVFWVLFFTTVLVSGCTTKQTGRVYQYEMGENGKLVAVEMSEYFEAKATLRDGDVLAHFILTLGDERVPEGGEIDISWKDRHVNDHIEGVYEVYFTNLSATNVVLDDIKLSYYGGAHIGFSNEPVTISSRAFYKTDAFVISESIYKAEVSRVLKLKIDGVEYQAEMQEQRTPLINGQLSYR